MYRKVNFYYIVLLSVLVLFFFSCKKNIPGPINNTTPISFSQIFDSYWQDMNDNYVYWDVDTTNWDKVHNTYKPLFDQLKLNSNTDVKTAVGYFRSITSGLIDGHYNITFSPAQIKDSSITPSFGMKMRSNTFHSPFLYMSIDSNYLDKGFSSGTYLTSGGEQAYAVSGTIKNKILYFYCNQFYLQEAYTESRGNGVQNTLKYFFDKLKNMPKNIKEIIVDVRNNNGGAISDLNFFMGRLTSKPFIWGYTHYKSGAGRLSYTPWIDAIIYPEEHHLVVNLPIIVLADNYSRSLAEAVTMAIHTLPRGKFIGETTWGATGPITDYEVYNDGSFNISNFLSVYTSSAAFKYIDGKRYEGKGFPPDIYIPFNFSSLYSGDDQALDAAISLAP